MPPVIDLHCDLLGYLIESPNRTPHDAIARCSLPQLRAGGVATQVLAIFTIVVPGTEKRCRKEVPGRESSEKIWSRENYESTLSACRTAPAAVALVAPSAALASLRSAVESILIGRSECRMLLRRRSVAVASLVCAAWEISAQQFLHVDTTLAAEQRVSVASQLQLWAALQ